MTGPRTRRALIFAGTYVLYHFVYTVINRLNVGREAHQLFLPGEKSLPLVVPFAFVYAGGFLLPVVVLFVRLDAASFNRLLRAFWLTATAAFVVFVIFPVSLERPAIPDVPGARLLRLIYVDQPNNDFPSLHVAVGWLVYLACRRITRWSTPLLIGVLAVSVSTVLVKQHYVVDVLGGIAFASVAWKVAGRGARADRRASSSPAASDSRAVPRTPPPGRPRQLRASVAAPRDLARSGVCTSPTSSIVA